MNEWWLSRVRSPCFKVIIYSYEHICWELWRARNLGRYEGIHVNVASIILNVRTNFKAIFSAIVFKRDSKHTLLLIALGI